jgi:hypothetical protein
MAQEDGTPDEGTPEGTSRRSFLQRMAVAGLVGVPVISSFGLVGCDHGGHGGGGNTGVLTGGSG